MLTQTPWQKYWPAQVQLPCWHASSGFWAWQASSTAGSSSTMPSQSSSLPLQTSGAYWHWQTLPLWPSSGPQVQPATHAEAVLHGVVQTFPVQAAWPAG